MRMYNTNAAVKGVQPNVMSAWSRHALLSCALCALQHCVHQHKLPTTAAFKLRCALRLRKHSSTKVDMPEHTETVRAEKSETAGKTVRQRRINKGVTVSRLRLAVHAINYAWVEHRGRASSQPVSEMNNGTKMASRCFLNM